MLTIHKLSSLTLYQLISAAFCVICVMSNIISVKMVKLPFIQDFSIPAGLLIYPLTFLLSDLVTEVFGPKKAKLMVYITLAMNVLSFGIIQLALLFPASTEEEQFLFRAILGLSSLRIFSSLTAYLVSQMVDIQLYTFMKKATDSRFLWLRNNVSTCASQLIDTVIVDMIYLYGGLGMSLKEVMPIMFVSYVYKAFFSFATTPLFYLSVFLIKTKWKLPVLTPATQSHPGVLHESNL